MTTSNRRRKRAANPPKKKKKSTKSPFIIKKEPKTVNRCPILSCISQKHRIISKTIKECLKCGTIYSIHGHNITKIYYETQGQRQLQEGRLRFYAKILSDTEALSLEAIMDYELQEFDATKNPLVMLKNKIQASLLHKASIDLENEIKKLVTEKIQEVQKNV